MFSWLGAVGAMADAQAPDAEGASPAVTDPAPAQQDANTPLDWQVAPSSISDLKTPGSAQYMDMHFTGDQAGDSSTSALAELSPELDAGRRELDPFFRDSTLDLTFRTAYFREENITKVPESTAWAMGGNLVYKSGWWQDFVLVGAGFYTSNGLYKPYGEGGTHLLRDRPPSGSQHNVNVIGQAYVELKYEHFRVKVYRQALDTPFINEHYTRMTPQLFEAYVIGSKQLLDNTNETGLATMGTLPFNFLAGYVREELNIGESSFNSMSAVATDHQATEDRGVVFGGVQFAPADNLSLSLWEYYGVDMFNTIYFEGELVVPLSHDGWKAKFALQFIDQRSVGSELTGSWSGQSIGLLAGAGRDGFTACLRFTSNFDGLGLRAKGVPQTVGISSPWGRYPGFNKSTVKNFNSAESSALGVAVGYDFLAASRSLDGLELAASYTYQFSSSAEADYGEFDIVLSYEAPLIKGLRLDVLTSWVSFYDHASAPAAINDYRVILNYTIPLL